MLFDSLEFAVFLAVLLALVPWLPHRPQNLVLLAASYLFYAAWDWRFLGLLVLTTGIDWALGLAIGTTVVASRRRALLVASVAVNLGVLGFFKYAGFFADNLCRLLSGLGLPVPVPVLSIVLPVGISFYTFQSMSYTIDVYRGHLAPTRNPLDFALFVAFFPQLVAGPIERAVALLPQVARPRRPSLEGVGSGTALALWGLYKKVVIADNLAPVVEAVYHLGAAPVGGEVLLATYAFAVQIYCDFSGYSDIARGVARILGFELMVNFDRPYLAGSLTDFWRRWHISLSTWLRDYLYVPLGGGRGGERATLRNLFVTMLLGGLWHGAAWNFLLWGGWHGLLLAFERRRRTRGAPPAKGAARAVGVLLTFHLVCVGWVLFRAPTLDRALALMWTAVTSPTAGLAFAWLPVLAFLVTPLVAMETLQAHRQDGEPWLRLALPVRALVYLALVTGIVLLGEDGGPPFLYFQF